MISKLLLLLLLICSSSQAAIAVLAYGCANNLNSATTAAADTTGATLIVLGSSRYQAVANTISDSASNSYTGLTEQTTGGPAARLYYKVTPTTSATHTFTNAATAGSPGVCFIAFSGTATSTPFDVENGAKIDNNSGPTTLVVGSVTPNTNGQVLVSFTNNATTGANVPTISATNGITFTITNSVAYGVGCCYGLNMAYSIETTATATNATWNYIVNPANYAAAVIGTFKTPAVASTSHNLMTLGVGN